MAISDLETRLTVHVMARAMGNGPRVPVSGLASVRIERSYCAPTAEIAHLQVVPVGYMEALALVAKVAHGPGREGLLAEIEFHRSATSKWLGPAPRYYGSAILADGSVLLLTEDLSHSFQHVGIEPSDSDLAHIVNVLAGMHASFWERLHVPARVCSASTNSLSALAAAWPPTRVIQNCERLPDLAATFLSARAQDLTRRDRAVIEQVIREWPGRFQQRTKSGRKLTAIHGDFHLIGNVMRSAYDSGFRVIDWADFKPGIGPHDLAYCLLPLRSTDKAQKDISVLSAYWHALVAAGVTGYTWELCQWDYKIALITNLFQCMLQNSSHWLSSTVEVLDQVGALSVLSEPLPL